MELSADNKRHLNLFVSSMLISISLMFYTVDYGESGGYWFFARSIAENWEFQILDRSPLYSMLLVPFYKLGMPYGFYLERVIGTCIGVYSFLLIARKSNPIFLAACLLGFLLYARASPPAVQWYGVACVNFGLYFIIQKKLLPAFIFLFLAYLFRGIYIFFLVILVGYCLIVFDKKYVTKKLLLTAMVIAPLVIMFQMNQSNHKFNNAQVGDTKYFPGDSMNLLNASFIQSMSWKYNERNNKLDSDFYFTHKELFGEENTLVKMVNKNPKVVIDNWLHNTKRFIARLIGVFFIGDYLAHISVYFLLIPVILGLYIISNKRYLNNNNIISMLILLASVPAIIIMIFFVSKDRYYVPMIPAIWLVIDSLSINKNIFIRRSITVERAFQITSIIFIFICSVALFKRYYNDGVSNDLSEFTNEVSWLNHNINKFKCNKVLFDSKWSMYGTYLNYDIKNIQTIFSLPPFEKEVKLNCIVFNDSLRHSKGNWSTNDKLRYDLHISKHYEEKRIDKLNNINFLVVNNDIDIK